MMKQGIALRMALFLSEVYSLCWRWKGLVA